MDDLAEDYTGTEAELKAQDKKRKDEIRRKKYDFQWLMGAKQGRRIVWELLEATGVYRSSFSSDTHVMSFQEGKRNLGLELMAKLHRYCPDEYMLMTKEHQTETNDNALSEFI